MNAVMGVVLVQGDLRQIPKYGLTLEEVGFCYGNGDLVKSLRAIQALQPAKRLGRTMIFDAGHVAEVWARYIKGEFDALLATLGK